MPRHSVTITRLSSTRAAAEACERAESSATLRLCWLKRRAALAHLRGAAASRLRCTMTGAKKILAWAKGFRGRAKNCISIARERVEKGLQYAYRDRRNMKRNMRALWIQRINAGAREHGVSAQAGGERGINPKPPLTLAARSGSSSTRSSCTASQRRTS